VEPIRLFAEASGNGNNQRPDILLRNPRGFDRQIILDVALRGINGQSRTSDDLPDRPLQICYEQKMDKYGQIADQNRLQLVPAVFSHTGQIHGAFKSLIREQTRQKLVAFEGQTKPSKIKSVMKWWSKCISTIIAKTASRSVVFKAAKIAESAFAGQSETLNA